MITALIFFIHLIFSLIVFTKKWQDEGMSSGLTNIALIGILFSVGWAITGQVSKALMDEKGFGLYFDRDTFSLTILTIAEFFFYRFYYRDLGKEEEKTEVTQ